jgi:hypothetical protein
MGILGLIGLSAYKSSIFLQHFGIAREYLIVHETLVKSLLQYGIALAKADFDEICKNERMREVELILDQGIGRVILSGSKDSIGLTAQLEQKGSIIYAARCRISKNSEQKLAIEGFQREGFPL